MPASLRRRQQSGQTLQQYTLPLAAGVQAVYNSSGLQYYRHADWLGSSRFAGTPSAGGQPSQLIDSNKLTRVGGPSGLILAGWGF